MAKPPFRIMFKWLLAISAIVTLKFAIAQENCNIQSKYNGDGSAVKFIFPETIDSSSESKCRIGLQFSGRYNYITLSLLFKSNIKSLTGDLVVKFSDSTTINVPLTSCSNINPQNLPQSNCIFLVLDKYISPLKTKTIDAIIYQFTDNTFKAIDMKKHGLVLKNAILCLNP